MARNTPIIKDWYMLGLTVGATSSILKTLFNVLLNRAGVDTLKYGSLASSLIHGKKSKLGGLIPSLPKTKKELALGYIADTMMGGLFGIVMARISAKTPPGNEAIKGATNGAFLWAITLTIGNLLKLEGLSKLTTQKMAAFLSTSVIFGTIEGMVFGKYGSKLITESHPILVKEVVDKAFDKGRLEITPSTTDSTANTLYN